MRARWWRFRRQVIAWLRSRYHDGSTIIVVALHEWRAWVPPPARRRPWWLRWTHWLG